MTSTGTRVPGPGQREDPAVQRWWPTVPEPSPRRQRKHAIVDTLRTVITDVAQFDVEAADEDGLRQVEDALETLRRRLRDVPDLRRAHGSAATSPGPDRALFERSPLTGRSNPLATPLTLRFEADRTYASTTFDEAYEGPPGTVHGGFVVSAFDDLLGVAQAASGVAGLTGTLTVRLHAPTPLHRRIDYEAGVHGREGRRILAWGRSTLGGDLLAEAEGVFVVRRGS